jgi:tetratricopeptide (TPR) repeat protein
MLTQQGDHARAAAALTSLGALHHQLRDWPQARAAFSRALELYLAAGPAGPETAVCHNGLGSAAFESGRLHEAVLHFEAALEQYGDDPGLAPWRAKTLANLGRVTLPLGDPSRSESLLQRALAIQEAALGPHHPDLAVTLGYLAQAEAMRGEKHRSAALRKRAKAIRAQAYDANGGGATVDVSAWMGRPR